MFKALIKNISLMSVMSNMSRVNSKDYRLMSMYVFIDNFEFAHWDISTDMSPNSFRAKKMVFSEHLFIMYF